MTHRHFVEVGPFVAFFVLYFAAWFGIVLSFSVAALVDYCVQRWEES